MWLIDILPEWPTSIGCMYAGRNDVMFDIANGTNSLIFL
jgi:hypothetical protein